jgi:DNA repair protein RecO (recombination protein O)
MPLTKDEAIVIRRLDYSETSQVVVLFGRSSGKIRAIAKGIKRSTKVRFAVGIDLLDVGHVMVSARSPRPIELATVTEWKQSEALSGLRSRLERMHAAGYAAEVVAGLTEDWDPHPALFDSLLVLLRTLCEASDVMPPLVAFQQVLLAEVGSLPDFQACMSCGRVPGSKEPSCFSSVEGGLVCRDCESAFVEKLDLPPGLAAVLGGEVDAQTAPGAFAVLDYHISHLMGRAPLTSSLLRAATRGPR